MQCIAPIGEIPRRVATPPSAAPAPFTDVDHRGRMPVTPAPVRRVLVSGAGWLLVALGVVLFPLPGPGLLLLGAGAALLARHDPWAAARLEPWRRLALREAARGVATWPRTLTTVAVTTALGLSGLLWLWAPPQPAWWVLPAWTWLPGGAWAGVGQLVSGVVALGLTVQAHRRFHGAPEAPDATGAGASGAPQDASPDWSPDRSPGRRSGAAG